MRRRGLSRLALLAACSATGPVATYFFLPALPEIRAHFAVEVAATQVTLSAYLIAFACAILFTGPLSDRFGRRPLMIGGVAVFALGSMLGALAPSVSLLVFARIVQAVGAGAALTVARAVIGDLYADAQLARAIAMLTMVMMAGTSFSPWLGGEIVEHLGWRSGFWLLFALGATLLVACIRLLPEPPLVRVRQGDMGGLWRQSLILVRRRTFFGYTLQAGMIYAAYLVFIALAPHVMAELLQRPPSEFGLYILLLAAGFFSGNLYVSRASHRTSIERTMTLGLAIQMLAALAALGFALAGLREPVWWFLPMAPFAFGQGIALPNITARAVSLAPGYAGTASSLIGFSQQAIAAVSVQAMGWAPTDTPVPMLWFCFASTVIAWASAWALRSQSTGRAV